MAFKDTSDFFNEGFLLRMIGAWPALEPEKIIARKQQIQGKVINGMLPNNQLHGRRSNGNGEVEHKHRLQCSISLLDFKVAMELNPTQLGEYWNWRKFVCIRLRNETTLIFLFIPFHR
ncbi:uncharacterized protein LOC120075571 [Benincasa hispida]|uniref:uncharacterized protein LOC120075571 n=1 Tax=Benincasa hispida TaxID=102211 RepID=UPI0018FFF670|nr:uncharacterized protein LOC120075571 [Benincasa hispida]